MLHLKRSYPYIQVEVEHHIFIFKLSAYSIRYADDVLGDADYVSILVGSEASRLVLEC